MVVDLFILSMSVFAIKFTSYIVFLNLECASAVVVIEDVVVLKGLIGLYCGCTSDSSYS